MRGNSFGNTFTITTFGESHGVALGVIVDGIPAGLQFDGKGLQDELDRRRPGRLKVGTSRNEADQFEILSGVFDDKTLGTPITVAVRNTNQRSKDYIELKDNYRPGHADQTTMDKFGHRDHRGGGRSSGRETLARVIGGYFASLILPSEISFSSKITKISGLDPKASAEETEAYLLNLKKIGESAGGIVELRIENCPRGLGEPVFDKLKADLSKAMVSIGSCMGVTFGLGVEFADLLGSEISNQQANFGGIEGGISNGETIRAQLYFKAPSTIGEKATAGRHDPCILPRVLPVVEAMAKITICDHYLRQNSFQLK
jgi:chorismate synthase